MDCSDGFAKEDFHCIFQFRVSVTYPDNDIREGIPCYKEVIIDGVPCWCILYPGGVNCNIDKYSKDVVKDLYHYLIKDPPHPPFFIKMLDVKHIQTLLRIHEFYSDPPF